MLTYSGVNVNDNKYTFEKGAFQVKDNLEDVIKKYKDNLEIRLANDNKESESPILSASKIDYDISDRVSAIHCGGIGVVDQLVRSINLPEKINSRLELFQRHKPYYESDHILNIAYNLVCGGSCLEDIELLRNNIPYLNALGAERMPDPTTAGDFLRRFEESDIHKLMDIFNEANTNIWDITLDEKSRRYGIIDIEGKAKGEKRNAE